MKLRKTKRFNTVESYAVCVCLTTTCSCSCPCDCSSNTSLTGSRDAGLLNTSGQRAFNTNYYSYDNMSS